MQVQKYKNPKKFKFEKSEKKFGQKKEKKYVLKNSGHNIARCIKLFSFSLYNHFFWENCRT